MITKDQNSFWTGTPNIKNWKKTVVIIGSILFIAIASLGVASAKYGYENISSLVLHGHFETVTKNKIQNIPSDSAKIQNSVNPDSNSNSNSNSNNSSSLSDSLSSDKNFLLNIDKNDPTKYYTSSGGVKVVYPEYDKEGAVAICNNYTYSHSAHSSSTCSDSGGVMYWLDGSDNTPAPKKVCIENTSMKQLLEQQYQNQVTSIKQQEENELGQARVDLASRGVDSASGAYLSTIQSIEDKYKVQLSNLKNEYDQKINAVEPVCHNE